MGRCQARPERSVEGLDLLQSHALGQAAPAAWCPKQLIVQLLLRGNQVVSLKAETLAFHPEVQRDHILQGGPNLHDWSFVAANAPHSLPPRCSAEVLGIQKDKPAIVLLSPALCQNAAVVHVRALHNGAVVLHAWTMHGWMRTGELHELNWRKTAVKAWRLWRLKTKKLIASGFNDSMAHILVPWPMDCG